MKLLVDGQTLATPEVHRGIGRVVLAFLEQLVASPGFSVTVAVPDPAALEAIPPRIRGNMRELVLPGGTGWDEAFRRAQAGFDHVWHANPMMLNVRPPVLAEGPRHWATLYDLIPLVMCRDYLDRWPEALQQDYRARLDLLAAVDAGLGFISQSALEDFAARWPAARARCFVTPLAIDKARFWAWQLPPQAEAAPPFLLYTGGIDPRKNVEFAIGAFARAVQAPGLETLRFKIVCHIRDDDRARLTALAEKAGVGARVELTGFVPDDELARLYRDCAAFVFPSLYEGFGLPVLEALASGASVACARNSSLPEVAEGHAEWFDASDEKDAAAAIRRAVEKTARSDWPALRVAAVAHAGRFSWPAAALPLVERMSGGDFLPGGNRPRIGLVTPWPPQRSGIADYSRMLAGALADKADVTVFVDGKGEEATAALRQTGDARLTVLPVSALASRRAELDRVIYSLGNNDAFHEQSWREAWDRPDTLIIHDVELQHFVAHTFTSGEGRRYREEPEAAARLLTGPDGDAAPLVAALTERARMSFVHSRTQAWRFPDNGKVRPLPLGTLPRPAALTGAASPGHEKLQALGLDASRDFIIGTFGFPTPYKRIPSLLRAIAELKQRGYPVKLLIGGGRPKQGLDEMLEELKLTGDVAVTGYLDDHEFDALLSVVDVVCNLRFPTMGEVSAVLMTALSWGIPLITSRHAQFGEFPDTACWKVDTDLREVPQLVELLAALLESPRLRAQLGANAAEWAAMHARIGQSARLILQGLADSQEVGAAAATAPVGAPVGAPAASRVAVA